MISQIFIRSDEIPELDLPDDRSMASASTPKATREISVSRDVMSPTPWKITMEPTNHPFRKENDLPNLHDYVPCLSSGVYIP